MRAACAIAALATLFPASHAAAEPVSIDLGWFMNTGGGRIYYDGAFTPWITAGPAPGSTTDTLIGIDAGGILDALGCEWLTGITITDTGANMYGTLSPGADIDLLQLVGVENAAMTLSYDGPNANHDGETSWHLAYRTAALDSFSGAQEWDWTHVSLGAHGSLSGALHEAQRLRDTAPYFWLSEAGSSESFRVSLEAIVPAPAGLTLLGAAALRPRRRRRG
jgi:hypothetical protein